MALDGDGDLFLGAAPSLTGRRWRLRPANPETTRAHQAALGLSEPLARALASRGVASGEGESFLRPTLKALFPDPSSFLDMDKAAGLLIEAMLAGASMVVFADYDVDGACSAAELVRWFRHMGRDLPIYVPARLTEGYGPSPEAFRRLRAEGVELVITVDCGASARDALAEAARIGLRVVVIDHHLMGPEPAIADALVNPNRPGCNSGQGVLCAAGVTFVLLAALNREARSRGLFQDRPEPDLRQWLDLAALGAVCDVTQLVGFNRALTVQGLRVLSQWANPGLAALMHVAGAAKGAAGVFEAGFVLGPRINAGGRIGRSDLGARLLATDDAEEAAELARELDALNSGRKSVEAQITDAAIEAVEADYGAAPTAPVLVVAREGWHPGVIGIVAGRLRERYRRPVIVIGLDGAADIGKGSGRSQAGVNLGAAVQQAFETGLLLSGGGHAMAAGLAIRPGRVEDLKSFLSERLEGDSAAATLEDCVEVDALISPGGATRALYDAFQALAPFGPGNPEPIFAMANVRLERASPMRGGHIRCDLVETQGARIRAIAWRAADTPLGAKLLAGGASAHVAGRLKADDWNGRRGVQLEIEDIVDLQRTI